MQRPPNPKNERHRLAALRSYDIMDSLPEREFDDLTFIAAAICRTPISYISFIDRDRQWLKAAIGLNEKETERYAAICSHTIVEPDNLLVVPDTTKDPRFKNNPLVLGNPPFRFYAGAALHVQEEENLGAMCVVDTKPRRLNNTQIEALQALSRQVAALLHLRKAGIEMEQYKRERKRKLREEVLKIKGQ